MLVLANRAPLTMSSYDQPIAALERAIGEPHSGLPEPVFLFVSRITPLINVDLLIQDEQRGTLLTWRDDEHYGPGWHIPGGIIRYKESAADRVRAVAHTELGADVEFDPAPIFVLESIASERNRGHFYSLLYRCRLRTTPDESRRANTNPPRAGAWSWHPSVPAGLLPVHRPYAQFL
jgi:colanic acid biosynthesis protein WcaH